MFCVVFEFVWLFSENSEALNWSDDAISTTGLMNLWKYAISIKWKYSDGEWSRTIAIWTNMNIVVEDAYFMFVQSEQILKLKFCLQIKVYGIQIMENSITLKDTMPLFGLQKV